MVPSRFPARRVGLRKDVPAAKMESDPPKGEAIPGAWIGDRNISENLIRHREAVVVQFVGRLGHGVILRHGF